MQKHVRNVNHRKLDSSDPATLIWINFQKMSGGASRLPQILHYTNKKS